MLSDFTSYELGIIWAIGVYDGERFTVRHREKYFLAQLTPYFPRSSIYTQIHPNGGEQHVLRTADIKLEMLTDWGWDYRIDNNRKMPPVDDPAAFIRAYVELHSVLDLYRRHKKSMHPRLRIYGGHNLISDIERHISILANTSRKTIQTLHNGKTGALYYQSTPEIRRIFDAINGQPRWGPYYDKAQELLK